MTTELPNTINLRTVDNIEKWLKGDNTIYIGRSTKEIPSGSIWGNPFKLTIFNSRREVVKLFEIYAQGTKDLSDNLSDLKGKVLGCWCSPDLCHGEILHKLAGNHPVYQCAEGEPEQENKMENSFSSNSSGSTPTKKLLLSNLGTHITAKDLCAFFGLGRNEYVKSKSAVELSVNTATKDKAALIHIPEEIFEECCAKQGSELSGRVIHIKDPTLNPGNSVIFGEFQSAPNTPTIQQPGDEVMKNQASQNSGALSTLASIAAEKSPMHLKSLEGDIVRYVVIDTTNLNDCYHVPSHAEVVYAIGQQFPKDQEIKTIQRMWGRSEGLWKIETDSIQRYEGIDTLTYDNRALGTIQIRQNLIRKDANGNVKRERIYKKDDRRQSPFQHDENDLLITLKDAYADRFSFVTNEMILKEIIKMDIGKVKKGPQPQRWRESDEFNGNKFFVLGPVHSMPRTRPSTEREWPLVWSPTHK